MLEEKKLSQLLQVIATPKNYQMFYSIPHCIQDYQQLVLLLLIISQHELFCRHYGCSAVALNSSTNINLLNPSPDFSVAVDFFLILEVLFYFLIRSKTQNRCQFSYRPTAIKMILLNFIFIDTWSFSYNKVPFYRLGLEKMFPLSLLGVRSSAFSPRLPLNQLYDLDICIYKTYLRAMLCIGYQNQYTTLNQRTQFEMR